MDGTNRTRQWSSLCEDLLQSIASFLDSRIDLVRFRGVCSTWRSVIPLPNRKLSPFPLKLPFPILLNHNVNPERHGYFELVETTFLCIQPLNKKTSKTKCWLVEAEEFEEVGKLRLKNPLSQVPLEDFHNILPKVVNLFENKVTEVSKGYALEFVDSGKNYKAAELKSVVPKKVVVSAKKDDIAVMAIHPVGKLAIWRMGSEKWVYFNARGRVTHRFEDIAYHNGKFYAVDNTGWALSVDPLLKTKQVAPSLLQCSEGIGKGNPRYKYLVKSEGHLFLLDKYTKTDLFDGLDIDCYGDNGIIPCGFEVYKLNEEEHKWVPVKSLGETVMFVGDYYSFSLSAGDFPGCKKNCIYFIDEDLSDIIRIYNDIAFDYAEPGFDVALFDIKDCTAKTLSSVRGYSNIFWPPPNWI